MEAENPRVPLLERLRFAAIYSSNLDEFFRVRVASMRSIKGIEKKNIKESAGFDDDLLEKIRLLISGQLKEYGAALDKILEEMQHHGIYIPDSTESLSPEQKEQLTYYFKTKVLAYLRPYIFGMNEAAPFLNNQQLYLGLRLRRDGKERFAYINIPSDSLPRFFLVKGNSDFNFIYLDDIVRDNLKLVFHQEEIVECRSVKLNKDADLHIDDEFSGDLVEKIEKQIKKRNLGAPSRFLYDGEMSQEMLNYFKAAFQLKDSNLVPGGRYHNLNDYFQIYNPTDHNLEYNRRPTVPSKMIEEAQCILKTIERKEQLLHFPYQSYDYVLQFFNEAAIDPEVEEIYVTFYRMAKNSIIGEALISAANNGKKVIVFMELKARFDEENNLFWSDRMKKAGIKIIYSIPGLKVHAKVALVRKKDTNYGFFGTGNLNEKTAKIYCDHGLLTTDPDMTEELHQVFKFLHKKKAPSDLHNLIVSQFNAIDTFKGLIDSEIANHEAGKTARIVIKVNNLEEKSMIKKLYQAAEAGVEVTVIARSICCLVPNTCGIKVIRLVDRHLEHARIFYFENEGRQDVYLGSSDWMSRNLHRRIEVSFPVKDPELKQQVLDILQLQLTDNTNLVLLDEDLNNIQVEAQEPPVNAQNDTYALVKKWNE